MGIELENLDDFPIDPANSQQVMQKIVDVLRGLQRTVADNFAPAPKNVRQPWVSVKLVRVTGYASVGSASGLGANWFTGRTQRRNPNAIIDPTASLDLSSLYMDADSTSDDCYCIDAGTNKYLVDVYLRNGDSATYVWGTFFEYSAPIPANSSTNTPAVASRPVYLVTTTTLDGEFRLTGNRTVGGMYTGNPCTPITSPIDSSASGALTETTIMVANASITVYLLNKQEFGSSSHSLSTSNTPKTFRGRRWGTDIDGTPIFMIDQC